MVRLFLVLGVALLLAPPPPTLCAELFRWVDEKGVVHFTDNLHNIPPRNRGKAARIKSSSPSDGPSLYPAKASIPLKKKGQVAIIQATINGKAAGEFVVDTGASYTMISHAVAKELEIELNENLPTIPFQTANGVIHAPLVNLQSVEVGGMRVEALTAAVHDVFPDSTTAGLLGLNFLSNFRLEFDTRNGLLHLERK